MMSRKLLLVPVLAVASMLGACASDGGSGGLFTSSVVPPAPAAEPVVAARPKVDPQCVTLATQIDGLRKDGTIDRLEKVAAGKGAKVQVKRAAIAKQAELNKANAEFQMKCAPRIPASQEAAAPAPTVTPAAAAAAAPVAKRAAKAAAAAIPSGVTVAKPQ